MDAAIVGFLVVVLFGFVLAWPSLQAYRGRYRSWTYRGLGTRYGAFAIGWTAVGLVCVTTGGVLREVASTAGSVVGAAGLLMMIAGLIFFAWMPPFLVPRWRRELLKNAKLYRGGEPAARLNATPMSPTDGVVVWRRNSPVVDSEWLALSVSGMHVRPRTRLAGVLRGPLPDRATGIAGETVSDIEGELIGDDGIAVFAQSPSEDARHRDNWFIVLRPAPSPEDISAEAPMSDDMPEGCVVPLESAPVGRKPLQFITSIDGDHVHRALTNVSRTRRVRQTVDGRLNRSERIAAP